MSLKNHDSSFFKYLLVVAGAAMYSIGLAVFITPHELFTGGIMGFAQLLRSALQLYTPLSIPANLDLSGIIYYIINIPLFVIAFRSISRFFFYKTVLATTVITVLTSFVHVSSPIITDRLTSCVVGGLVVGIGVGFMLKSGGSGGGLDIVGMYLTKKYTDASVGKVALLCNVCLYLICAVMFNIETAVYSIIYTAVSSFTTDRFHDQNIMVRAMIFTKKDGIAARIISELNRGVTEWNGEGAYTHDSEQILVTIISKYEMNHLRRLVQEADPHAFITYDRIMSVDGNFLKRL